MRNAVAARARAYFFSGRVIIFGFGAAGASYDGCHELLRRWRSIVITCETERGWHGRSLWQARQLETGREGYSTLHEGTHVAWPGGGMIRIFKVIVPFATGSMPPGGQPDANGACARSRRGVAVGPRLCRRSRSRKPPFPFLPSKNGTRRGKPDARRQPPGQVSSGRKDHA